VGIRARGAAHLTAIRAAVDVPLIGLTKRRLAGYEVYITPAERDADQVSGAGADIIAVDATARRRPDGATLAGLIRYCHEILERPVLADIATRDEALAAIELGADAVSTTLSGYTADSPAGPEPDLALVANLAAELSVPLFAEGRYATPEQAAAALRAGAQAVVVGTAITAPDVLCARFVAALGASAGQPRS
jgi:N-acylglucosamine-6-phosphate 2-epimerase